MSRIRTCTIYFSPLMSVPFLGHILLLFQALLFCLHMTHGVFLPRYGGRFLKNLMRLLDATEAVYVVRTVALGHILDGFKNTMTLDVKDMREYVLHTDESYQCALWTLIHVDRITSGTRRLLEKQLGRDIARVLKEVSPAR